jgi:hypothetical protein
VTPYRASAEPDPEVLWCARVAKRDRRRSAALFGTIGGSLVATGVVVALGLPAVASVFFVVFLGAATVMAGKKWVFDTRLELRVERVGAIHRLRVTNTPTSVIGPFVLMGASRLTEAGYLLMQLEIRSANGTATTVGAIAESYAPAPTRDDWFDGAPLADGAPAAEYMLNDSLRLMRLRKTLASLE